MKILIFMCFLLFIFYNLFSQTDDYPGLYSDDFEEIIYELELIVQNNDQGAIEILHILIEEQAPNIQLNYLRVLSKLEDGEIISYCNDFISRADNFSSHEYMEDPLEMRIEATKILMENGDFSTIDYVFDYFDLYKPDFNSLQREVLIVFPLIASNVPSTLNQIENDLIYVFNNSTISENRFVALHTFDEIFIDNVLNMALIGIVDDDQSIRNLSLSFLVEYKYHDLNNVLRDRLLVDPGRSMRTKIVHYLLEEFGAPSDLKFVIDYQPNEIHPTSRSIIGFYIQNFIPSKPDSLGYYDLATRLISYTEEMFQYGWIENEESRDYYIQQLTTVYESIEETGEIGEACSIIDERILQQLEQDLAENIITTEAYKFIYYYTNYIKEEIEKEFGSCP